MQASLHCSDTDIFSSSSGLLIFAATVDLLAEDFLSDEAQLLMTKKMKIWAFTYVLMGAASMSVVGAFA
jgi:hypothetical protein